ncbi:MAG: tetratricopeptide repeat protein [Alistipes sp.]|jgi:tetratricopeptide (TPR) repeat protein|nr:tetratricopeptide repeat protein [Alistipes sp.]
MAKRRSTAPKAQAAQTEKDPEVKIENALGQTEAWIEKNWKPVSYVLMAALVVAAAVYAYEGLYRAPRSQRAADAMFVAEQHFIAGDWATALNGDGVNSGFVDLVADFGGTSQGRLAAHYAGIAFLKEGDLDNALTYLSKYRPSRGIPNAVVNAQNEGLRGDVYVQKGDYAAAVGHFRKAVDAADNILTTPLYLRKLGLALEATGDYAGALAAYKRVSEDYPASLEARDITKLAAEAEQKL